MQIATFTSGKYTQLGIKTKNGNLFKTIESKILFQSPDLFSKRFLLLLSQLFRIKKLNKDDQLIFALNGVLDFTKKEVVESQILNNISFLKYFNGFSFSSAFDGIVEKKNIYVISDSDSIALALMSKNKNVTKLPALSIYIDENVSMTLVKNNGRINYNHSIRPIPDLGNKTAHDLLCDNGTNEILLKSVDNIFQNYSNIFSQVLDQTLAVARDEGHKIKNILVHSTKGEYILQGQVINTFPEIDFYFSNTNINLHLPILGSLEFLAELSLRMKEYMVRKILNPSPFISYKMLRADPSNITPVNSILKSYLTDSISKIIYYSKEGKRRQVLKNFDQYLDHWSESKPIVDGDNYYIIYYSDKTKIKLFLNSLNTITDLYRYNFFNKKDFQLFLEF